MINFYCEIKNIKQAVWSFNNKSTAIVIVTSIHIIKFEDFKTLLYYIL